MKTYTRDEVADMLRKRQGSQSLRKYAASVGMSAPYLSDILNCNRHPGPKVLRLLNLRAIKQTTIRYAKVQP